MGNGSGASARDATGVTWGTGDKSVVDWLFDNFVCFWLGKYRMKNCKCK